MRKRSAKQKMKDEAWKAFSLFIRTRDCLFTTKKNDRGKCITCGIELPIGELQAGHFISGRHNSYLFSEEGVHAQCRTCNILKGGNQLEYRRQIIDLYGDKYDEVLEKESHEIKKYTLEDYKEIRDEYKERLKEIKWK